MRLRLLTLAVMFIGFGCVAVNGNAAEALVVDSAAEWSYVCEVAPKYGLSCEGITAPIVAEQVMPFKDGRRMQGIYVSKTGVIYINVNIPQRVFKSGTIIHEMVHRVTHISGVASVTDPKTICKAEAYAFKIQHVYLKSKGWAFGHDWWDTYPHCKSAESRVITRRRTQ